MRYRKVRLDRLNFSSTPVRLHRSEQYMEQLKTSLEYGLLDNYVRAPLSAYEEALVVRSLVEYYQMSQKEIALKLGKNKQHISRLLSVFDLIDEVQEALHEGRITLGHAVECTQLRDSPKKQRRLLLEILERGLSVKAARTRVQELLGEGKHWIIKPGEVWVSKEAKVTVYPSAGGYKVDFSFSTPEEFEKIVTVLRNRLSAESG